MMTWFKRHDRLREKLSAYIDGQLAADEMGLIDEHLAACEACRRELDDLRLTVSAVREIPEVEAPRSFRLVPEQVLERGRRRAAPASDALGNGMRLAGAALAFALAVMVVIDAGNLGGGDGEEARTLVPQPRATAMMSQPKETVAPGMAGIAEQTGQSQGAFERDDEVPAAGPALPSEGETSEVAAETPQEEVRPLTEPEVEPSAQKGPETPEEGGGASTLRVAQIALAAALALVIIAALARALWLRRNGL